MSRKLLSPQPSASGLQLHGSMRGWLNRVPLLLLKNVQQILLAWNDTVSPVQAESPTDYVRFSTDYGNCWHRIDLPKALDVQNIRSALRNDWASVRHGVTCGSCQSPSYVRCFTQGVRSATPLHTHTASALLRFACGRQPLPCLGLGAQWVHAARCSVQRHTDLLHCRLEPSGKSHVFALHGQECRKSNAHPKCTMERNTPGWPKGMLYMLDITEILRQGEQDWPVRLQPFRHECSCC